MNSVSAYQELLEEKIEKLEKENLELRTKLNTLNDGSNPKFKQFEIRKPTLLYVPRQKDYFKYNFDLVKWVDDNSHCMSIGFLRWNTKESWFQFESVGTRYLECREDGLEEWLLKWCESKSFEYRYVEDD